MRVLQLLLQVVYVCGILRVAEQRVATGIKRVLVAAGIMLSGMILRLAVWLCESWYLLHVRSHVLVGVHWGKLETSHGTFLMRAFVQSRRRDLI